MEPQAAFGGTRISTTMMSNIDASLTREDFRTEQGIDPQADRWFFTPLRDVIAPPDVFRQSLFLSLTFYRLAKFETRRVAENGIATEIHDTHRQMIDLSRISGTLKMPVVDLLDISNLPSEEDQLRVLELLVNPLPCPKYGDRLNNRCAVCYLRYLTSQEAQDRVETLKNEPTLYAAAISSVSSIVASLRDGIQLANERALEALLAVDRKEKKALTPVDYWYIFNTHREMPSMTTRADNEAATSNSIEKLTDNINLLVTTMQNDGTKRVVRSQEDALKAQVADLQAQIEKLKAPSAVDTSVNATAVDVNDATDPNKGGCKAVSRAGVPCKNPATVGNYCTIEAHQAQGEENNDIA